MKKIAFIYVYNEMDILPWTIDHLLLNGIDIHISDNWSTDGSFAIITDYCTKFPKRVTATYYPIEGPVDTVSWFDMMKNVEQLALDAARRGYHWCIHHDADEIRRSKQPNELLSEAIDRIDAIGFNAINHDLQVYRQRKEWDSNNDPESYFTDIIPNYSDVALPQIKCWKQSPDILVNLSDTGGHCVNFPNINIATERFILKHYPLRSVQQAARKIEERQVRWSPLDRARGWHWQYDVRYGIQHKFKIKYIR